jgi:hypothetical protein
VFRWLKSLTAWHTAARDVVPSMKKSPPVIATFVRLNNSRGVTPTTPVMAHVKSELLSAITNSSRKAQQTRQWLEERIAHPFGGNVHAEAGLLALARASSDSEDSALRGLRDIFEVSRRSLYTCDHSFWQYVIGARIAAVHWCLQKVLLGLPPPRRSPIRSTA